MIPRITIAIALSGLCLSGIQAQQPVPLINSGASSHLLTGLKNTDSPPPGIKLRLPVDSNSVRNVLKRPASLTAGLTADLRMQQQQAARMLDIQKQLSSFKDLYKNPIAFNEGNAVYSMTSGESYMQPGSTAYFGNVMVNSSWMIVGIPVSVSVDNQTFNDNNSNNSSNLSFHFDRDTYLNSLKKKRN